MVSGYWIPYCQTDLINRTILENSARPGIFIFCQLSDSFAARNFMFRDKASSFSATIRSWPSEMLRWDAWCWLMCVDQMPGAVCPATDGGYWCILEHTGTVWCGGVLKLTMSMTMFSCRGWCVQPLMAGIDVFWSTLGLYNVEEF